MKTICPICGSDNLIIILMTSGPHHAKRVCQNRHFIEWVAAPRVGTAEIPEDLVSFTVKRTALADLKGTPKQVAMARSLRSNMISFANKVGREDYTRLLACIEDASWFLANRGLFPPEVKWPKPEQLAAVESGAVR